MSFQINPSSSLSNELSKVVINQVWSDSAIVPTTNLIALNQSSGTYNGAILDMWDAS